MPRSEALQWSGRGRAAAAEAGTALVANLHTAPRARAPPPPSQQHLFVVVAAEPHPARAAWELAKRIAPASPFASPELLPTAQELEAERAQLRRAGVEIVIGVDDLRLAGEEALAAIEYRRRGRWRTIDAHTALLHQGVVPETNLAMAAAIALAVTGAGPVFTRSCRYLTR